MSDSNLILIGMPGAGKSTVGVILAKRLGYQFIDTDLVIQTQEQCRLQEIIDRQGLEAFRKIEEQTLLRLQTTRCVIATGGSVIYSQQGVESIGKTGRLVYLKVPLTELQQRIADMGQRGLVMGKEQSFADLFSERTPLYERFAELTIDCNGLNAEQVAAEIETQLESGILNVFSQLLD